jgi:transposase-like protein
MPKVISSYRRARAVELALAGHSYDDIARQIGYSNRGTAWKVVQKALQAREVTAVDEYRHTELARLDRLQEACWGAAVEGDLGAIEAVIRIIQQRTRLLCLDQIGADGAAPSLVSS